MKRERMPLGLLQRCRRLQKYKKSLVWAIAIDDGFVCYRANIKITKASIYKGFCQLWKLRDKTGE